MQLILELIFDRAVGRSRLHYTLLSQRPPTGRTWRHNEVKLHGARLV